MKFGVEKVDEIRSIFFFKHRVPPLQQMKLYRKKNIKITFSLITFLISIARPPNSGYELLLCTWQILIPQKKEKNNSVCSSPYVEVCNVSQRIEVLQSNR
jgi:hypothetical protein